MSDERCCGRVNRDRFGTDQCTRKASGTVAGKYYCRTHNPDRVKAKREAKSKAWEAEYDANQKAARVADRIEKLRKKAGLYDLTERQLRLIVSRSGIVAILKDIHLIS